MTDWCILRCGGGSTLRLAKSLELDEYHVWTPIEYQVKRDRRTGERVERIVAVMPTYVFADAGRLSDLVSITLAPMSPHPGFSVFHYNGKIPLVDDSQLSGLRLIERKAALQNKPVIFPKGVSVKIPDGAFQGLTGQVIEDSKGQHTLVAFPGFHIPVKFSTWQLNAVELKQEHDAAHAA